jgi:hypothetical protein
MGRWGCQGQEVAQKLAIRSQYGLEIAEPYMHAARLHSNPLSGSHLSIDFHGLPFYGYGKRSISIVLWTNRNLENG